MSKNVTACVIIIGNEILSGRTQDLNLKFLSEELNLLGVQVREARVIPDIKDTIIETLHYAMEQFDYVLTTGGIGPTHDDITSACVAEACGAKLERNAEALKLLKEHYSDEMLIESRLKMADIPIGADLIENPISKAPGFKIKNIFVLAGVPQIAKAQFDFVRPMIEGGDPVLSKTVNSQLREGDVAEGLEAIQSKFTNVDIGSYPYFKEGNFGVSLVLRSQNREELEACAADVAQLIKDLS